MLCVLDGDKHFMFIASENCVRSFRLQKILYMIRSDDYFNTTVSNLFYIEIVAAKYNNSKEKFLIYRCKITEIRILPKVLCAHCTEKDTNLQY